MARNESNRSGLNPPVSYVPELKFVLWDLKFPEPISVPEGTPLVTLRDAGAYIAALPEKIHAETAWHTAIGCLLFAVHQNGPIEFARLAMMQALHPKPEPVYRPHSRDPKWRNNYKLVRDR